MALDAGQDVEPVDSDGMWRIARKVSKHRMISTVIPSHATCTRTAPAIATAARPISQRPATGIITACQLTPANTADGATGIELLADEPSPVEVYADSAYGTAEMLALLDNAEHIPVIKPWPLRRNPNLDDYRVDYTARTVTCPNGVTVALAADGVATFKHCTRCPLRSR